MFMRDPKILEDVKRTLALLSAKAPGRAIEVRVPPYAAVQCGDGPTHTRGTPANVIEMDAGTWLALANGETIWELSRGRSPSWPCRLASRRGPAPPGPLRSCPTARPAAA